jgi:hypothetical protein
VRAAALNAREKFGCRCSANMDERAPELGPRSPYKKRDAEISN